MRMPLCRAAENSERGREEEDVTLKRSGQPTKRNVWLCIKYCDGLLGTGANTKLSASQHQPLLPTYLHSHVCPLRRTYR